MVASQLDDRIRRWLADLEAAGWSRWQVALRVGFARERLDRYLKGLALTLDEAAVLERYVPARDPNPAALLGARPRERGRPPKHPK
jgi:hypothetical protein